MTQGQIWPTPTKPSAFNAPWCNDYAPRLCLTKASNQPLARPAMPQLQCNLLIWAFASTVEAECRPAKLLSCEPRHASSGTISTPNFCCNFATNAVLWVYMTSSLSELMICLATTFAAYSSAFLTLWALSRPDQFPLLSKPLFLIL